jgi:hypothetical protein
MTKIKIFILERSIKILRKLAIMLAIIPAFLCLLTAHAATYGSQTDLSGSIELKNGITLTAELGAADTTQGSGSSTITLWVLDGTDCFLHLGDPSESPLIKEYSDSSYTTLIASAGLAGSDTWADASSTTGAVVFYLDTPAFWQADNYYKLDISPNECGDRSRNLTIGADASDTTAYNIMGSPGAGISFVFPYNGESLMDFDNGTWDFTATGLTPGQPYVSMVSYTLASSSIVYADTAQFTDDIPDRAFHITKQTILTQGIWSAYAVLYLGSSTTEAANAQATFTITTSSTIPIAPSCNFTSSSFLGDPVGNIKQGICAAIIWAFYPSGGQIADLNGHFTALTDAVKNKPPFGYFQSITTGLGSFQATSTPSSTLLDSSGTAVFSNAFSGLDIGLAAILWFLFGWYIFHRMKNIEL